MNFAVAESETVHRLGFSARKITAERKSARLPRHERHALFERARDEKNISHVRVKIAHEFLDAFARRAVVIAERVRDGWLQIFSKHVHRTVHFVMQFRPRAQQKT